MNDFKMEFTEIEEDTKVSERKRTSFGKLLPAVKKRLDSICRDIKYVDLIFDEVESGREELNDNIDRITQIYNSINSQLHLLRNAIYNYEGFTITSAISTESGFKAHVTYEENDRVGHIVFDKALYKRPTRGYENRDMVWCDFCEPLIETMQRYQYTKRYEKTVLFILCVYEKESNIKDYDNLMLKPFIDGISSVFLIDDSPKYISTFYDYKIDEKERTEVYLIPYSEFSIFLQSHAKSH